MQLDINPKRKTAFTGRLPTFRARWRYGVKHSLWDYISEERSLKTHRLIVADVELPRGKRLSRELLSDVESLLIHKTGACGNGAVRDFSDLQA